MITEEHTGCEARDIQHGDLRLLEAVVGVQLVDVGPLQPVPQQRREVDQVETALETETRAFFICQQQCNNILLTWANICSLRHCQLFSKIQHIL